MTILRSTRCSRKLTAGAVGAIDSLIRRRTSSPALESRDLLFHLVNRLGERTDRPFLCPLILRRLLSDRSETFFQQLQFAPSDFQLSAAFNAHSSTSTMPFGCPCQSAA